MRLMPNERTMDAKVLIIAVNYQGADSTLKFIESVKKLESSDQAYVVIVDNASPDSSASMIQAAVAGLANVELMESSVNRGYFGGANWALLPYLARRERPDWVIVCNNDISFDDPGFVVKLLQRDPEEVGMLAPAIVAALTGLDSNPFLIRRPTRWEILCYRFWLSHYSLMAFKQRFAPWVRIMRHKMYGRRRKAQPGGRTTVYAAHGAFMIFSRKFFASGGFIDDGFFLYAEEFCAAEVCLRLGLPVIHDPGLRVAHQAHQTVGRYLTRTVFRYQQDGFAYAREKYLEERPLRSAAMEKNEVSAAAAPDLKQVR